jgi:hypothetical protein
MAGLFNWFGGGSTATRLPEIFPMVVGQKDFVTIDCETIYKRILTDVLERTEGLTEDEKVLLWDNCLGSEKQDGLVSMLAKAMVDKSSLFLVYIPGLKLIRKANATEEQTIRADYKSKGESKVGIYITFENFRQSDMIKLYSALEYCGVNSFWKSMNLSKALQIKVNELRSSTGMNDKADIEKQAVEIAKALSEGLDIYIDAKDVLELLNPDLTATNSAMELIEKKRSFYLGLPASYLQGDSSKGLNDSGKGDQKKVEQGLRGYYFAIIKPVLKGIFSKDSTYKSEDFDQIMASMEVMKTFSITDDELVSMDNKRGILNKMLGLPADAKGDEPKKPEVLPLPAGQGNQPPPQGQ